MRYPEYELVAEIRRIVTAALQPLQDDPLSVAYERVEALVLPLMQRALAIKLRWIAIQNRLPFVEGPLGSVAFASVPHEIFVVSHDTNPNLLLATVRATIPGSSPLTRQHGHGRIERLGRYSRVRLTTSRLLRPYRDELTAACELSLQIVYEELMAWTLGRFASIRADAAAALYHSLRALLPESVRDQVWLYAFASGQGFYVPDDHARDVIFERVRERTIDTRQSPISLAADFLTHVLPYEKTFSKYAVELGAPIEGVFATAPYADESLAVTEAAVYQTGGLFTQPVASAGKAILVAGYPVELRTQIEGPLRQARAVIEPILSNTASALHEQLEQVKELSTGAKQTFGRTLVKHIGVRPVLLGLVDVDLKGLIEDLTSKKKLNK